jgi:hypothetical protein
LGEFDNLIIIEKPTCVCAHENEELLMKKEEEEEEEEKNDGRRTRTEERCQFMMMMKRVVFANCQLWPIELLVNGREKKEEELK